MSELVFYPIPTVTVDGTVRTQAAVFETWATIKADTSAELVADATDWVYGYYIQSSVTSPYWTKLARAILLFDTSDLPDGAVITAVSLSLAGYSKTNTGSWTPKTNVYSANPISDDVLEAADQNPARFGTTPYSDTDKAYADWTDDDNYTVFEFNAAGIAAINKTGITKLSLRDVLYDAGAGTPTWGSNVSCTWAVRSAEYGGATKPKLIVTYTVALKLDTLNPTNIQETSATLNGEITDVGAGGVDERGFVYATQSYGDPGDTAPAASEYNDNGDYVVNETEGAPFAAEAYDLPVTGLTEGTKYYVRAYAHNADGYAYGDEVEFNTHGWLGTWANRIEISIDYTNKIGGSVTWLPIAIIIEAGLAGVGDKDVSCIFDELQSDANRFKIAVTKSDGWNELYVEVERWDDAGENAVLHVSRDGWTIDADTSVFIYYDSAQDDNTDYVGDLGSRPEVWNDNFKMVQHMEDAGSVDVSVTDNILKVATSPYVHNSWGLSYPATYKVNIPAALTNAKAYHRHKPTDSWAQLTGKESTDAQTPTTFYNGIECVRWDYVNDHAYVSLAFGSDSDEIYFKITDASDVTQTITFDSIPEYYDNRKATVIWSADDFGPDVGSETENAFVELAQSMSIWVTLGFHNWGSWAGAREVEVQGWLDAGFVEMAQHTLDHQHDYEVTDFDEQLEKYTLLGYVDLPSIYKKGSEQYIWCFIEPFGDWDLAAARMAIGKHKYLAPRNILSDVDSFASWAAAYGSYDRRGTYHYIEDGQDDNLVTLKSEFDTIYAAGNVYSAFSHDSAIADYTSEGYLHQFMDYIKEKKDIWYVGLGAAYLYRFVEQLGNGDFSVNQVVDSTSNVNDGIKKGAGEPAEANAKMYKGQDFDGSDDYITLTQALADILELKSTGWTVAMWLNVATGGTWIGCRDTINQDEVRSGISNTALSITYDDHTVGAITVSHAIDYTGAWVRVMATIDSNTLLLYANGALVAGIENNVAGSGNLVSLNPPSLGERQVNGAHYDPDNANYCDGLFDGVIFANTTLNAAWAKADYNSGSDTLLTYGDEQELHLGAATLSGVGTLAASSVLIAIGRATLSGVGNLVGVGYITAIGKATLSGVGTLTGKGVITAIGKATLAGVGTLSAALISAKAGAATLAGVGTLAVIGHITAIGKATLSGVGTLASSGIVTAVGKAVLAGIGTLTAIGRLITRGLSNYMEDAIINFMRGEAFPSPAQTYVALFTSESGLEENNPTSEVSGGAYARQALTLDVPTNGETENSADIWFPKATAGWGNIACAAIVDHPTNSNWGVDVNVIMTLAVGDILTIESGDRFKLPAGDLDVAIV